MSQVELFKARISGNLRFQRVIDTALVTTVILVSHKETASALGESADGHAIAVGYCGRGKWVEYCFRFALAAGARSVDAFWRADGVDPAGWTQACHLDDGDLQTLAMPLELDVQDRGILGRLRAELQTLATFERGMWQVWPEVARELAPGEFHLERPDEVQIPHELLRFSGITEQPDPRVPSHAWKRTLDPMSPPAQVESPRQGTDRLPIIRVSPGDFPWSDAAIGSAPVVHAAPLEESWEGSERLEFRQVQVSEPEGLPDDGLREDAFPKAPPPATDLSDDETLEFQVDFED